DGTIGMVRSTSVAAPLEWAPTATVPEECALASAELPQAVTARATAHMASAVRPVRPRLIRDEDMGDYSLTGVGAYPLQHRADEIPRPFVSRTVDDIARRALLDDAAAVEEYDDVRHLAGEP